VSKIAIPARFDPAQRIDNIVLVGAGGTGAQWARSLCRIVYDLKRRGKHAPKLRFVDPDQVEVKNVGRQLYLESEIGQSKAEVLARRFSFSLGLEIEAFAEGFDADKHANSASLVCGAVDNHLARQALAQHNGLYVDCGNHADGAAQICVGNTSYLEHIWRTLECTGDTWHYLPHVALLFPALLEGEPEQPQAKPTAANASCAELIQAGEQGLVVNDLVAAVAAQYCYLLLNQMPVTTFISFCDASTLNVRSLPNTPENLKAYLQNTRRAE